VDGEEVFGVKHLEHLLELVPVRVSGGVQAILATHRDLRACVGEVIGQSNVLPVKRTLKGKRG
jgi:hypothetical protein